MRARDLASVAFVVLGVHLLLALPTSASSALFLIRASTADPESYGQFSSGLLAALILLLLLILLVGVALIRFRHALGRAAFPDEPDHPTDASSPEDLAAVLLAVAGVWLFVTGLRDAVPTVTEALMRGLNPLYGSQETDVLFVWPERVAILFQLVASVLLFFGSHGLAQIWHSLRRAGHVRSTA